jgi:hypothetical protein
VGFAQLSTFKIRSAPALLGYGRTPTAGGLHQIRFS